MYKSTKRSLSMKRKSRRQKMNKGHTRKIKGGYIYDQTVLKTVLRQTSKTPKSSMALSSSKKSAK